MGNLLCLRNVWCSSATFLGLSPVASAGPMRGWELGVALLSIASIEWTSFSLFVMDVAIRSTSLDEVVVVWCRCHDLRMGLLRIVRPTESL